MYLIFFQCGQNDTFVSIIGTTSYDVTYTDASGEAVTIRGRNTNQYLTGDATTGRISRLWAVRPEPRARRATVWYCIRIIHPASRSYRSVIQSGR